MLGRILLFIITSSLFAIPILAMDDRKATISQQNFKKNIISMLQHLRAEKKYTTRCYSFSYEDFMLPPHDITFTNPEVTKQEKIYSELSNSKKEEYLDLFIALDTLNNTTNYETLSKIIDDYYDKLSPLFWRLRLLIFAKERKSEANSKLFECHMPNIHDVLKIMSGVAVISCAWLFILVHHILEGRLSYKFIPIIICSYLPVLGLALSKPKHQQYMITYGIICSLMYILMGICQDMPHLSYVAFYIACIAPVLYGLSVKHTAIYKDPTYIIWENWSKIVDRLSQRIINTYQIS
jgi:hypothetical protein